MNKFKIGDTVEYLDGEEWIECELLDIDICDADRPYKISYQNWSRWVGEDEVREKQEIKIVLIAKSNKACPLCGREGVEGAVFFYCNNASCINYYDRNR